MKQEENKEVEVFGTKEVSVKEFMGSSDKSLVLLSDFAKSKQNLVDLRAKHESRVIELQTTSVLTSDELKELNSIRGELREPRYLIQNIEKNNISVFESYKKTDKANLKELIDINRSLEDIASDKIKLEDDRKKAEKEAEAKAEENRIDGIKKRIETFESDCYVIIQASNIGNVEENKSKIDLLVADEFDYEEYDVLFEVARNRVQSLWDLKCADIQAAESQRIENESMKQEIFSVRVTRLAEFGYELVGNEFVSDKFTQILFKENVDNCSSDLFEMEIVDLRSCLEILVKAKNDALLLKDKNDQFDIRKQRLAELGIVFDVDFGFGFFLDNLNLKDANLKIEEKKVFNADIREFEQILVDAKQSIIDAEKLKEKKELADLEAKKQAKITQNKTDAENKARVKRLANDKKLLNESLEVYFAKLNYESENEEVQNFIVLANAEIQKLKTDLLTQLNEL